MYLLKHMMNCSIYIWTVHLVFCFFFGFFFCLAFLLRNNEPRYPKSMITRLFQLLLLNPERKLLDTTFTCCNLEKCQTTISLQERGELIHNSFHYWSVFNFPTSYNLIITISKICKVLFVFGLCLRIVVYPDDNINNNKMIIRNTTFFITVFPKWFTYLTWVLFKLNNTHI